MSFIHPGRLFLERWGRVETVDDVMAYVDFLRMEADLIGKQPPVDLKKIYTRFKIPHPKRVALPNQQGLLLIPEKGVILINQNDVEMRQRFTEAHELMELLFSALEDGKGWAIRQKGPFKHAVKERLCDVGAANLLMPRKEFGIHAASHGVSFSTARRLSRDYQVSVTAALIQLIQVVSGKFAVILWRMKSKQQHSHKTTSVIQIPLFAFPEPLLPQKLRIEWVMRAPNTPYMPYNKSVPETSAIFIAWREGVFTSGEEFLDLGSVSGVFRYENLPFTQQDERCVLSLLELKR